MDIRSKIKKIRFRPSTRIDFEAFPESSTGSPFFDVEDADLLGYIDNLMRACASLSHRGRITLNSREEAIRALTTIEKTHTTLQRHVRTARALRTLLTARITMDDHAQ